VIRHVARRQQVSRELNRLLQADLKGSFACLGLVCRAHPIHYGKTLAGQAGHLDVVH
jgi:hypothetical protein